MYYIKYIILCNKINYLINNINVIYSIILTILNITKKVIKLPFYLPNRDIMKEKEQNKQIMPIKYR
jgi:hypothetical protein